MPIDEFVAPLLMVPLFQGLKPIQLTEIARRGDRIIYNPAEVIVSKGTNCDGAVLIIAGEAVCMSGAGLIESGADVPVGSLLSEMALLVETEHSSTIVARTTVRALKILRSEIHAQMSEDPTLADHFVAVISGRLFGHGSALSTHEKNPSRDDRVQMPASAAFGQGGEIRRTAQYH